jgi:hypothetical protein
MENSRQVIARKDERMKGRKDERAKERKDEDNYEL